jgi:type III secretion system YscQ/HrcQ family protein
MHTRESEASPLGLKGTRRALRLRTIPAPQARLARLVAAGIRAELATDTSVLRLDVHHLRPATPSSDGMSMLLQTPAGGLALSSAREVVRVITSIDMAPDADGPLQALRLHVASQSMPSTWLALFGASTWAIGADRPSTPLEVTFSILQPQADLAIEARLCGSSEALLHALTQSAWTSRSPVDAAMSVDWPLRLPVRIGSTVLRTGDLRALQPGDLVLIDIACFDGAGQGELRIAQGVARGVLHTGNQPRFEVTEWHPQTTPAAMNPLDDTAAEQADPAYAPADSDNSFVDTLPVTLIFELGVIEMPLSELRGIGPGSVLMLDGSRQAQVSIRIGSRAIGTGELVELDDQLAVEIHRIGAAA